MAGLRPFWTLILGDIVANSKYSRGPTPSKIKKTKKGY
jgi:hypothetical protein